MFVCGALMNGISALIEETTEKAPLFLLSCDISVRRQSMNQKMGPHQTLIL